MAPLPTNPVARAGASLLRVRWLVRAPIWLYRARLGAVFGSRLLALEHVGRTSGQRRYVVLEVLDHPRSDTYVVASGFGERAQWYRNVRHNPSVRVYLGSRKPAPATARKLGPEAAAASLDRYAQTHPRSWARLKPVLEQTLGPDIDGAARDVPLIAIDVGESTTRAERSGRGDRRR